jgi:hypothetical protein
LRADEIPAAPHSKFRKYTQQTLQHFNWNMPFAWNLCRYSQPWKRRAASHVVCSLNGQGTPRPSVRHSGGRGFEFRPGDWQPWLWGVSWFSLPLQRNSGLCLLKADRLYNSLFVITLSFNSVE